LLEAVRSRLLLTADPTDDRHHLLLTTKHSFSGPTSILSYELLATDTGIPTFHWLGERDRTTLERLSTGPIRSLHRQAILHFLREYPNPCPIKDILVATSYDYEPGRKMLVRMQQAGELVSLGRGLYTTANHPCLANFTPDSQSPSPTLPVPVSNVPANSFELSAGASAEPSGARFNPSCPQPIDLPAGESTTFPQYQPPELNYEQIELMARIIASAEEAEARLLADGSNMLTTLHTHVPSPDPSQNSAINNIPTIPSPTTMLFSQTTIPASQKNMEPVPIVPAESDQPRSLQTFDPYPD